MPEEHQLTYACPSCGHATGAPAHGRQHGYCEHCHDYTGVPAEIPKAS